MEVKYREEQVITSPYVTQADKMAVSLRHLADRFLKMEPKKQCFTPEEMTEMYDRITEKVCRGCSRKSECLGRLARHTEISDEVFAFRHFLLIKVQCFAHAFQ